MRPNVFHAKRITAERVKQPEKLQSNKIPQMNWKCISMEFAKGLPRSHGYEFIYVVVGLLSKMAHLLTIHNYSTTKDITRVFIKGIFKYHKLPKRLISNIDSKFTSNFWKTIFKPTELNYLLAQPITPKSIWPNK